MLNQRLAFVMTTCVMAGAWLWLCQQGALGTFEAGMQDRLQLPRAASADIVIVAIDDASIQALSVWPWPRSIHAQLIDELTAAGARTIGYDVTFSEASSPSEDADLARAIQASGRVVLASEAQLEERVGEAPLVQSMLEPISTLQQSAVASGPTTLILEPDGVVRRVPVQFEKVSGQSEFSFASILANRTGRLDSDGMYRVAYAGEAGHFQTVSASQVLAHEFASELFVNKLVLVGATAPDLHDAYLTPFSRSHLMPGVEVQANIVQSLLEGRHLRTLTSGEFAALFGILTLLSLGLGLTLRLRYVSLAAVGLTVGYLLVAVTLARLDVLLPVIQPLLLLIAIFALDFLYRYKDEYARRKFVQQAFGRYVSPAVVERLVTGKAPLKLGGVKTELTILFSDIRGFTTLAEKLAPEDLVTYLNEYLAAMTEAVLEQDGTVDKYIGDAVMAFWGAPLTQVDHAERAVATALGMRKRLNDLNLLWASMNRLTIEIGIGLNTGKVIVGNLGSERRFDYTVIGDDVNLASRLESLTKFYGVGILISDATRQQLADKFLVRPIDRVAVKGKHTAVRIFELVCEFETASNEQLKFVEEFTQAQTAYYARDWQKAQTMFKTLAQDKTAQLFAERCAEFLKTEPGTDWDGTFTATHK